MFGTRPKVYEGDEFSRLVDEVLVNESCELGVQRVLYAQDITGSHTPGWFADTVLVATVNGKWGAAYYRGPDRQAWIIHTPQAPFGAPELIYDPYNGSTFPSNAVTPVDQLRAVVEEYLETGGRPTCVQWQEPDRYLVY